MYVLQCQQCKNNVDDLYFLYNREKSVVTVCEACISKLQTRIQELINKEGWAAANDRTHHRVFRIETTSSSSSSSSKSAFEKINSIIGQEEVKAQIKKWEERMKGSRLLEVEGEVKVSFPRMNSVFYGPSGSGKTMFAKYFAETLHELGLVKNKTFVQVSRAQLVAEYVGQTAPKVLEKVNESLGGVLFIDEAHTLISGYGKGKSGDFGKEVIDTLLVEMEKHGPNLTVIFAGYQAEMEEFLNSNEGLRSRIQNYFHFKDYTPEELSEIAGKMLTKQGYNLERSKEEIKRFIQRAAKQGVVPGNARFVRNLTEKIVSEHMVRIAKENPEKKNVIEPSDVLNTEKITEEEQRGLDEIREDALEKMDTLIGLETIKSSVKRNLNYLMVQKKKSQMGLPIQNVNKHMYFAGNPGTGKTTVARYIGQFLRGAGVLTNGHFVEISKSDLIGDGNVAEQVKKMFSKAKGGVMFIDEAYSLANGDKAGKEAIDALVKEMEDNRDNVVVILAGYEEDMQKLLQTNSGLESRLPYKFSFPDYSVNEIVEILKGMAEENQIFFEATAEKLLSEEVSKVFMKKGRIDGNGRWARNIFEKIIVSQCNRIAMTDSDDYVTILQSDIKEVFDELFEEEKKPQVLKRGA